MADIQIHLAEYEIANKTPYQCYSVELPIRIDQQTLDGLFCLIHYLDGVQKHGDKGTIIGHFELIMFLRSLRNTITQKESEYQSTKKESENANTKIG